MIEKSDLGTIEYRQPTIPEGLEILAVIGVKSSGIDKADSNELLMLSRVIANMGKLVLKVDCEVDGVKVTDFETICMKFEAMTMLSNIAGQIMQTIQGGLQAKKKQSKTP